MSIGAGHGAGEPEPEEPSHTPRWWLIVLGGIIGVFVLLAGYDLISGGTGSTGSAVAASKVSPTDRGTPAPSTPVVTTPAPSTSAPSTPAPSTPVPTLSFGSPSSPAPRLLTVSAVAAFGPDGTSDGDNPGSVYGVIDGGGADPWYSEWYASPEFGNLQSGTGILLDMGETVTVSSVRLVLGSELGADLQVRVGDSASLADLTSEAEVWDVGGSVQVPLKTPASGRYVLIWFTQLPPNGQGEYQVAVYSAAVDGTAAP